MILPVFFIVVQEGQTPINSRPNFNLEKIAGQHLHLFIKSSSACGQCDVTNPVGSCPDAFGLSWWIPDLVISFSALYNAGQLALGIASQAKCNISVG